MNLSAFIWSVADLLRGPYKPHEYGQVILPFTVLRRMDCVLEPTKKAVLKEAAKRGHSGTSVNPFLTRAAGTTFYNTSPMDLKAIVGDQDNIAIKLAFYNFHYNVHATGGAPGLHNGEGAEIKGHPGCGPNAPGRAGSTWRLVDSPSKSRRFRH